MLRCSEYFVTSNCCDANKFGFLTISTFTEAGQEDIKIKIPFAEIDPGNVAEVLMMTEMMTFIFKTRANVFHLSLDTLFLQGLCHILLHWGNCFHHFCLECFGTYLQDPKLCAWTATFWCFCFRNYLLASTEIEVVILFLSFAVTAHMYPFHFPNLWKTVCQKLWRG